MDCISHNVSDTLDVVVQCMNVIKNRDQFRVENGMNVLLATLSQCLLNKH